MRRRLHTGWQPSVFCQHPVAALTAKSTETYIYASSIQDTKWCAPGVKEAVFGGLAVAVGAAGAARLRTGRLPGLPHGHAVSAGGAVAAQRARLRAHL